MSTWKMLRQVGVDRMLRFLVVALLVAGCIAAYFLFRIPGPLTGQ